MRERSRDKGRLEDIIHYSENVMKIVDGVTFEEFKSNIMVYFSAMKNVEIVGEAAYMLTKEFKSEHPELPWHQIEGMRHGLVHGYSNLDPKELWDTAINSIPALRQQVQQYLDELSSENRRMRHDILTYHPMIFQTESLEKSLIFIRTNERTNVSSKYYMREPRSGACSACLWHGVPSSRDAVPQALF